MFIYYGKIHAKILNYQAGNVDKNPFYSPFTTQNCLEKPYSNLYS